MTPSPPTSIFPCTCENRPLFLFAALSAPLAALLGLATTLLPPGLAGARGGKGGNSRLGGGEEGKPLIRSIVRRRATAVDVASWALASRRCARRNWAKVMTVVTTSVDGSADWSMEADVQKEFGVAGDGIGEGEGRPSDGVRGGIGRRGGGTACVCFLAIDLADEGRGLWVGIPVGSVKRSNVGDANNGLTGMTFFESISEGIFGVEDFCFCWRCIWVFDGGDDSSSIGKAFGGVRGERGAMGIVACCGVLGAEDEKTERGTWRVIGVGGMGRDGGSDGSTRLIILLCFLEAEIVCALFDRSPESGDRALEA